MKYLIQILKFLNLLDSENNASLTNIIVIVAIAYLGFNPDDVIAISGAALALLNYGHKRHEATQFLKEKLKEVGKDSLKELTDKLNQVDEHVSKVEQIIPETLDKLQKDLKETKDTIEKEVEQVKEIKKLADELSDKVSKTALTQAFKK
jgi:gas vesicle protein